MKKPLVYIIILNWNGKEDTIECIDSVKKIDYPNYKIIIVDNGSVDDSVKIFKKKYPKIKIIQNKKNLGYAEGNNVGIRYALRNKADYILILNNDAIVDKKFLTELVKVAESDEKIGIVGPLVYYSKSNEIQFEGINKKKDFKKFLHKKKGVNVSPNLLSISGCAMLIKKIVLTKVGLIDSRYYLYYEDTDLCARTRKKGFTIKISLKSKILHKASASSNKINPIKQFYVSRNMFIFAKKNLDIQDRFYSLMYFFIIDFLKSSVSLLLKKRDIKSFKNYLRGISAGINYFLTNKIIKYE